MSTVYSGQLSLGNPSNFSGTFLFDTGSPFIWVGLSNCSTCSNQLNFPLYNITNSSSSTIFDQSCYYEYWWRARVSGDIVLDALWFNQQPLEMTFMGVYQASGVAYLNISGIIGLGPTRGNG